MFCVENKSFCKGGFVFVMITEIFWQTFWRDNWRSLIGVVENFRYYDARFIYSLGLTSKLLNMLFLTIVLL